MANYQVGTLNLDVIGISDITALNNSITALTTLTRTLDRLSKINMSNLSTSLSTLFTNLSSISIKGKVISQIANATNALSSLSKLGKIGNLDWSKVSQGFEQLAVSITPFLEKVQSAEKALSSLATVLNKMSGKKFGSILDFAKNGGGGGSHRNWSKGIFNLMSWRMAYYWGKRVASTVVDIVQAASDYAETMNLWQVAMRDNLDMADKFVKKVNQAYGISTETVMEMQGVFRNMIGSLGQITDELSYKLSQTLVQMTADYASLYNTTIESASQKMQSMLAGQVRPIRSAGLDITETTLYQFYQQLGGTKAMRQLNRTEKQLLSILAVYKQMNKAGATGDMTKTLNMYANQARMISENWKEAKTWTGLILKDFIDQNKILIKINAALITFTTIMKVIAQSKGLGKENYLTDMTEYADDANSAIDELQGKLLDFDKFRSMSSPAESQQGLIDENLVKALAGYESYLDNATNAAHELATEWLGLLGITKDQNGEWKNTGTVLDDITNKFNEVKTVILAIISVKLFSWIIGVVVNLYKLITSLKFVNSLLLTGVVYAIMKAVEAFRDGDYVTGIIATAIGVVLVSALVLLNINQKKVAKSTTTAVAALISQNKEIVKLKTNATAASLSVGNMARNTELGATTLGQGLTNVTTKLNSTTYAASEATKSLNSNALSAKTSISAFGFLSTAITTAISSFFLFDNILNGLDASSKNTVRWIMGIVGALGAVLGVVLAIKAGVKGGLIGATIAGLGTAALIAAIIGGTQSATKNVDMYANGASNLQGGTLFVAGEMGKTEAVYTGGNGKTNVANIQQMKAAFYQALVEYGRGKSNTTPIIVTLDGEVVYRNTTAHAKSHGKKWSSY